MRITTKLLVAVLVWVTLLFLPLGPARAGTYKKLSNNHIRYGVSQLLVGGLSHSGAIALKLVNPTPVTMVATALFYEREGRNGAIAGTFLGSVVEELGPHAALQIENDAEFDEKINPKGVPLYVEVISVPKEPVRVWWYWKQKKYVRLADGLGIVGGSNNIQGNIFLINPKLFSLPADDVFTGQHEAAIDSVCSELKTNGLGLNLFEEFGISCDTDDQ
jgi:hypothetical protein